MKNTLYAENTPKKKVDYPVCFPTWEVFYFLLEVHLEP